MHLSAARDAHPPDVVVRETLLHICPSFPRVAQWGHGVPGYGGLGRRRYLGDDMGAPFRRVAETLFFLLLLLLLLVFGLGVLVPPFVGSRLARVSVCVRSFLVLRRLIRPREFNVG